MRRLLIAATVALLVAGLFPVGALASVPEAQAQSVSTSEDNDTTIALEAIDASGGAVTAFTPQTPSHGSLTSTGSILCDSLTPNTCSQDWSYSPDENYTGSDSFGFTAQSDDADSPSATVSITVDAVNDDPTFTVGSDVTVNEDSGSYSDPSFITDGSPGPADESEQTLSYTVAADDESLFSAVPAVSPSGGLTFTPAADASGSTSVAATLHDSAGEGGATQHFTVTVTNVNDPVVAKADAVSVKATTSTSLNVFQANGGGADSAGPGESVSDLQITGIPTKPSKGSVAVSTDKTRITYDPSACATGSDSFFYSASDGEFSATAKVTVTINRPGQGGVSTSPLTDTPDTKFVTNTTMGTTVPLRVSWCGVTTSSTSARSYRVQQSTNSGSTYPTTLFSATTGRSTTRNVSVNQDYRWRVRTVDTAGRTGSYRSSLVSVVRRYQDTSSRITYSTGWGSSAAGSPSGGSERFTTTAGKTASITVSGVRAFAIVGPRSSTRGSVKVYVDDVLVATVSEKATTTVYRRVLYTRSLTTDSHKIRLESASSARVDLDAILTLAAK